MTDNGTTTYWDGVIEKALDRAGDDPEELLADIQHGVFPAIINASSLEYAKELAMTWRIVLRRFADGDDSTH